MKQNTNTDQFEAYLNGLLKGEKLVDFKIRLQKDPAFKKEFVQFLLGQASWSNEKLDQDREMMRQVYKTVKQVPYTKPNTAYLTRRFVSDNRIALSVAASLLLLFSLSWLLFWNPSTPKDSSFAQLMVEPVSMERASAVERQFFEKSSYFYYQDQPLIDSLEIQVNKNSEFGIPIYYLAHAYFKTQQYEKALEMFELCLGHLDYLNQVPQLQGSDIDIRFNTLLTKIMLKKDQAALINELKSIEKSIDPTHPLMEKLAKLKKELE